VAAEEKPAQRQDPRLSRQTDKQGGPLRVYDIHTNEAFVSVGVSSDTAEFSVAALRRWHRLLGRKRYPRLKRLLVTADSGGSNGARNRLCNGWPTTWARSSKFATFIKWSQPDRVHQDGRRAGGPRATGSAALRKGAEDQRPRNEHAQPQAMPVSRRLNYELHPRETGHD
jgi:hypothetical protein